MPNGSGIYEDKAKPSGFAHKQTSSSQVTNVHTTQSGMVSGEKKDSVAK